MKYNIAIKDKKFETEVGEITNDGLAQIIVNGESYEVMINNYAEVAPGAVATKPAAPVAPTPSPAPFKKASVAPTASVGSGTITAPIPGLVIDVKVKVGDQVTAGQTVAIMEAMKMENDVISTVAGTVKEILVQKGSEVATGDMLMIVE